MCIAGTFACAVSVGAQSTTTDQRSRMSENAAGHAVTVTGCLTKSGDGSYMLTNARMDTSMGDRSDATTTSGTGSTTASGTSGTTGGTAVAGGSTVGTTGSASTPTNTAEAANAGMGSAMSWLLHGGSDLDKHVGHKVQVSGRTSWDASAAHSHPDTTASSGTTATGTSATSTTSAAPPTASSSTTPSGSGHDMQASEPRLDVQSVKMVSASCQ
jgi:hypothetical protein